MSVLTARPSFAVVRIADGEVIAAQFQGHELTGTYLLVPIAAQGITLRAQKIGKLHRAKVQP